MAVVHALNGFIIFSLSLILYIQYLQKSEYQGKFRTLTKALEQEKRIIIKV